MDQSHRILGQLLRVHGAGRVCEAHTEEKISKQVLLRVEPVASRTWLQGRAPSER